MLKIKCAASLEMPMQSPSTPDHTLILCECVHWMKSKADWQGVSKQQTTCREYSPHCSGTTMLGKNNGFFASVFGRKPKSVYITKRSTRCCSHVGIHARESALLTSQRSSGLQFMHNFGVCLTTKDACGCIPT